MIADTAWLLLWGTLVGVDLASAPQVMIARPLVAGTVAGIIVGDPVMGGVVGAILELFALDVLPIGAVRYPDYGLGAVAAAATASGAPGALGIGLAVAVGLVIAYLGQVGIQLVRRRNTADVRRHRVQLDAGRPRAIAAAHWRGLARDGLRAFGVTAVGLMLAAVAARWPPVSMQGAVLLSAVLIGAALAAATSGAMRLGRPGTGQRWFLLGLSLGVAWVVLL